MMTSSKSKPFDRQCSDRLKRLSVGKSIPLTDGVKDQNAWYRAARRLGIKISIRSLPNGLVLWRLQ